MRQPEWALLVGNARISEEIRQLDIARPSGRCTGFSAPVVRLGGHPKWHSSASLAADGIGRACEPAPRRGARRCPMGRTLNMDPSLSVVGHSSQTVVVFPLVPVAPMFLQGGSLHPRPEIVSTRGVSPQAICPALPPSPPQARGLGFYSNALCGTPGRPNTRPNMPRACLQTGSHSREFRQTHAAQTDSPTLGSPHPCCVLRCSLVAGLWRIGWLQHA